MRLQKRLVELETLARVVAISPTPPEDHLKLEQALGLGFKLLSDEKALVAGQYGLAYDDPNGIVPRPTTIVLDKDGRVVWSWVSSSLLDRADPDDVLRELQQL